MESADGWACALCVSRVRDARKHKGDEERDKHACNLSPHATFTSVNCKAERAKSQASENRVDADRCRYVGHPLRFGLVMSASNRYAVSSAFRYA